MQRKQASDFHPEVMRVFDQYVHGQIDRRGFFNGVAKYAVGDREALKAAGVKYEAYTYPNTQHGFNNDTTPRYDKAAADLAWQRTVAFLDKNLRG